jgi:hypothetical protein
MKYVGWLAVAAALFVLVAQRVNRLKHPYPELSVFVEYEEMSGLQPRRLLLTDRGAGRVDLIDADFQKPAKLRSSFIVPAVPREVTQLARQVIALSQAFEAEPKVAVGGVSYPQRGALLRASDGRQVVSILLPWRCSGGERGDCLLDGLVKEIDTQAQLLLCLAIEKHTQAAQHVRDGNLDYAISAHTRAQQILYDWRGERSRRYSYLDCWGLHDFERYPSGMDQREVIDYAEKHWASGTDQYVVIMPDAGMTIVSFDPEWVKMFLSSYGGIASHQGVDPILRRLAPMLNEGASR